MAKSTAIKAQAPTVQGPETFPISDLNADPRNPREISPKALDGLTVSTETFGDLSGIVFNRRTGQLVGGHQRLKALTLSGASQVVVAGPGGGYIEHPKTGEKFLVRIVDWDETRQRLANLTANNPHIQGAFTDEAVAQLKELEDAAEFASLELEALLSQLEAGVEEPEPSTGLTDPDAAAEPPEVPFSQLGDVWILGQHRLMCGDATSASDVATLMEGEAAVLMATDPPYGVSYTATKANIPNSGLGDAQARWGDIQNDELQGDGLGDFLDDTLAAAKTVVTGTADSGPAFYVWHPSGELNHIFRTSLVKAGILIHRQIIWAKPSFVLTRSGQYHWSHEPCFYGWLQGRPCPWYGEKNQRSVWDLGRDEGKAVHPTQKPVAIFEIPMQNHTRPGDICYEPFSGSGSQIIAGERLGRKVRAMELSPRWVDAAVARWEAFTGNKAVLRRANNDNLVKA